MVMRRRTRKVGAISNLGVKKFRYRGWILLVLETVSSRWEMRDPAFSSVFSKKSTTTRLVAKTLDGVYVVQMTNER
jgi:hypothetical protein